MEINKIGGIGASDCGKLFTKEGLKAKTAMTLAYEKAVEIITGVKKDITTAAMMHGIFSEEEAYNEIVRFFYPNSVYQSSESILIKDGVWVTPDVVDNTEGITFDIKCPYTPYTYWQNVRRLPDSYISQNQMQMIGTGHKKGMICLYLTSTQVDDWGNKIEYDIPIEQRHCFLPIEAQKPYQDEIMKRIDGFFPIRDKILLHIAKAPKIDDMDFFKMCEYKKVTRLKDKHNLLAWENQIFKNQFEYYVIEN